MSVAAAPGSASALARWSGLELFRLLRWLGPALMLAMLLLGDPAAAHDVSEDDKDFVQSSSGIDIIPFIYLGAKHMMTGYDHLLFLFGVIFFLYRLKDVAAYVTLFAIGHSTTLLLGVVTGIHANPYIIDAIIGLSVVYKALDNLGGFKTVLGFIPNQKAAVLIFGFFHGFGLASKLQELSMSREGLIPNLISFNVGVELGQLMALTLILLLMNLWRLSGSYFRSAVVANAALMAAGFVLIGYQLAGYAQQGA
jgi:hypothetical protein